MRAIKIDPETRSVTLIDVNEENVAAALSTEQTDTVDLDEDHCVVIDDGSHLAERVTRFRIEPGPERPFFGTVLVLGLENGNWAAATLDPAALHTRIIWERWDPRRRHYDVPQSALAR